MALFSLIPFDGSRPAVAKQFFINEGGIRFVRIPAGSIALGQSPDTPNEIDWSRPYARADRSFYLSATVITQQQYLHIAGRNPSDPSQIQLNAPVQCITWAEATAFCEKLSKREGHKYRLPTPMEWKYALYSGESDNLTEGSLDNQVWFVANSGQRLQPVGEKAPNLWGLYDMLGNVRQWCSDVPSEPANSNAARDAKNRASHFAEGTGYISSASDCLSPLKLETSYPEDVAMPTIGFELRATIGRIDLIEVVLRCIGIGLSARIALLMIYHSRNRPAPPSIEILPNGLPQQIRQMVRERRLDLSL